MKLKVRKFGF